MTRKILTQWQTEFAASIGKAGTRSKAEQDAGFEAHQARAQDWYKGVLGEWFG